MGRAENRGKENNMKAYQMKITLKYASPPIWRRLMAPTGIDFYDLHRILNAAMGWHNMHLFSFSLEKGRILLEGDPDGNATEDLFDGVFYPEFTRRLNPSDAPIDTYLQEGAKFSYEYDFGDDWKHTVVVEKIVEDYPNDFAEVVKYKGNCPLEDVGGIDGQERLLHVASDPSHPDYKEMMEWAGKPESWEYDVADVNAELRYMAEKKHMGNAFGKVIDFPVVDGFAGEGDYDGDYDDSDLQDWLGEADIEYVDFAITGGESLSELLDGYSDETLIEIADSFCPEENTAEDRAGMLRQLQSFIPQKDPVMAMLLSAEPEGFARFCEVCQTGTSVKAEDGDEKTMYLFLDNGLLFMDFDGNAFVPKEVAGIVEQLISENLFDIERTVWALRRSIEGAVALYGIVAKGGLPELLGIESESWPDMENFLDFLDYYHFANIDDDEDELLESTVMSFEGYYLSAPLVCASAAEEIYDVIARLEAAHEGIPPYVPTEGGHVEYAAAIHTELSPHSKRVLQKLAKKYGLDGDRAKILCAIAQVAMTMGGSFENCEGLFWDLSEIPDEHIEEESFRSIHNTLIDLWNNSRMIAFMGHTPLEMQKLIKTEGLDAENWVLPHNEPIERGKVLDLGLAEE
jgi:hypothetical protein